MKSCRVCGESKPLEEYPKSKQNRDGHLNLCVPCNRAKASEWQRKNRDRATARQTAWKRANAERVRTQAKAIRDADPERFSAAAREWAAKNPEKRRAVARASAERHREQKNAQGRARYAQTDRETKRARGAAWRNANPEKVRAHRATQRAARREGVIDGAYTRLLLADPCAYCGARTERSSIDHITALSAGGGNEWENVTAACTSCNSSKHTDSLLRFMLRRAA